LAPIKLPPILRFPHPFPGNSTEPERPSARDAESFDAFRVQVRLARSPSHSHSLGYARGLFRAPSPRWAATCQPLSLSLSRPRGEGRGHARHGDPRTHADRGRQGNVRKRARKEVRLLCPNKKKSGSGVPRPRPCPTAPPRLPRRGAEPEWMSGGTDAVTRPRAVVRAQVADHNLEPASAARHLSPQKKKKIYIYRETFDFRRRDHARDLCNSFPPPRLTCCLAGYMQRATSCSWAHPITWASLHGSSADK
jgi:hypothetical protein